MKPKRDIDMDDFNRKSLIKFTNVHPVVVNANYWFFDDEVMERFGYQEFDVESRDNKRYLTVDRTVVHDNKKIDLNTREYELDEDSKITSKFKIRSRKVININHKRGENDG